MDPYTETGSVNLDSSLWPHASKSLPELLTEICQKAQKMLKLIKDGQPESTDIFLTFYQSLGESYNHLNQELLNGFLNFDIKPSSSDKNSVSFRSDSSPSLEFDLVSGVSYSSLKLNDEAEKKDQSAYMLADFFSDELRTALRDLEERNTLVGELESKLSDSNDKIKTLERELDECHELLEVSEVEVSKLNEMLTEKADNGADLLLNTLRAELRSRDVQIEQMEEYLNQVCVKDTELLSDDESGTNKSVVEELKSRVEELENQVEKQSNVISEREEEKREAIRELCVSLDHYKSRYTELVISLSGNN
ncbi:hypothetical protein BRARA_E02979 [Brassica rapa]|uniref:NAB domain-containing protein n=1 Tax=Brassica campestris TaxID=3711 RepID=A0A397ZEG4_BRACM|nr:hypothetical protein BRARA_E02979 [Brassica rapa]